MLTGQLPFPADSFQELVTKTCHSAPEPPRALEPTVPKALERLCLRALTRDPKQRYADGDAFADALELALSAKDEGRALPVATGVLVLVGLAVGASALAPDSPAPTPPDVFATPRPVAPSPSDDVSPPVEDVTAFEDTGPPDTPEGRAFRAQLHISMVISDAEAGDVRALVAMGSLARQQGNLPGETKYWYRRAAAAGSAKALSELAGLHEKDGDLDRACAYFEAAIHAGDTEAVYELGSVLWKAGDSDAVRRLLDVWIPRGHVGAAALGARRIARGEDLPQPERLQRIVSVLCAAGESGAGVEVGTVSLAGVLLRGELVGQDEPSARALLETCTGPRGQMLLADVLRTGRGGPAEPARALELLRAVAGARRDDFAAAAVAVGEMLAVGEGCEADPARALEWYRRAADGNNLRGMCRVALHEGTVAWLERVVDRAEERKSAGLVTKSLLVELLERGNGGEVLRGRLERILETVRFF